MVSNVKISRADRKVVDDIIMCLGNKFGKEDPLTATQGKVLEYLGMMLDYTCRKQGKYVRICQQNAYQISHQHEWTSKDASRKSSV